LEGEYRQLAKVNADLLEAAILVSEGSAVSAGTTPLRMKLLRAAIEKATE